MNSNFDEWYIGNLVFGGLIGFLIVDSASGAMWELDDEVTTKLVPVSTDGCTASSDETNISPPGEI